jgi:DNA polymerase-3 subunit delta
VGDQVKAKGGIISSADARFLVEYAGSNQLNLENEIEKLVIYDKQVTRATIEELCDPSPQSTVFQLVDAVFAGNYKKAEQIYFEQRAQKVEPYAIMGMLAWQLHILALVKVAGLKSTDAIAKEAKLSPYVVKKTQGIVRRLTMAQIKQFVRDAKYLDIALKSQPINADEAMTTYLLKLTLE